MAIKYGRPIEPRARFVPVEGKRRVQPEPLDLAVRPRRNRRSEWTRRMVRENVLTTDDLI
jgi:porphobilinogen synthase